MQGCTGISAAGLGQLQQCMRLRYLDLSETQVVGLGFLQLRSAPEKGEGVCVRMTRGLLESYQTRAGCKCILECVLGDI